MISRKNGYKIGTKTSPFSTKHREKNNSILSDGIVSAILLERWRNRWFVKDIDSIGQRHRSRRCLPSSVHCEIVCRYESLVIKRILRLSEFHPSLLREVHNCIFNADTRAPVCRRGRKRGKTRYQRKKEREGSKRGERKRELESGMMFGNGDQQKSNLQGHIKRYLDLVAPLRASIPRVLLRRGVYTPEEDPSMLALLARLRSLAWKKSEGGSLKILKRYLTFRIVETRWI